VQRHDQTAPYGTATQIREHIRNRFQILREHQRAKRQPHPPGSVGGFIKAD
jgi:hypothetical protein